MNLLFPSPELPLRIIQLSLTEDENASKQMSTSRSVLQLWVGGGPWQVQARF